jgi:hypothetical protein
VNNDKNTFSQENMVKVKYGEVRKAHRKYSGDKPFDMRLSPEDAAPFVHAVNMGIDSHLEACFVPARGDKVSVNSRQIAVLNDQPVHGLPVKAAKQYLDVEISAESLPVLLRRLYEDMPDGGKDGGMADKGMSLASSMMMTLGFNDTGKFVGRDD